MNYRKFSTSTWQDPWFESLNLKARMLFIYLWTNNVCNQAGLYQISKRRIEFEVGFKIDDVILELSPKVYWDEQRNIVWVRNFFRWQCQSGPFAKEALESLKGLPEDLRQQWIEYNKDILDKYSVESNLLHLSKLDVLLVRDNFTCQYCGKEIEDVNDARVDYIMPRSSFEKIHGSDSRADRYSNLVLACQDCSQKKVDKTAEEFCGRQIQGREYHANIAKKRLLKDRSLMEKFLQVKGKLGASWEQVGNMSGHVGNLTELAGNLPELAKTETVTETEADINNNIAKATNVAFPRRCYHNSEEPSDPPATDGNGKDRKEERIFITIPLIPSHGEYAVTEQEVEELQQLYPGVDVRDELRRIRAWNLANPRRRKTKNGIRRHINTWLATAQDRARSRTPPQEDSIEARAARLKARLIEKYGSVEAENQI